MPLPSPPPILGLTDGEVVSGLTPCQLEAHSLLMAQPFLFDGALSVPDVILAVIALTIGLSAPLLCDEDPPSPSQRMPLKNRIFRL